LHQPEILNELLIVYVVAGLVVFTFHRFRAPSLVGLLLGGVIVGPYGLGLVSNIEAVEVLAETGVVILLFTIGLELSLSKVVSIGSTMLAVGLPQVGGAVLLTAAATYGYFGDIRPALFAGMLVMMSSTAVVMKLLVERGEIDSPYGRVNVAVLLLQDLLVAACMLSLPLLSNKTTLSSNPLGELVKGLAVVVFVLLAIRIAAPRVMFQMLRTGHRELFLITIMVACIGSAGMTAWAGLSLALGAFLAGLGLSDSEYAHQTLAEVLPFRDTLSSLFFISVGMLLDVRFVGANLPLVTGVVLTLLLVKFSVVAGPMLLLRYPQRTIILSGLSLAQIGEFSFILANRGLNEFDLLTKSQYQIFLAAAVITMALTPLLVAWGPSLADRWIGSGSGTNLPAEHFDPISEECRSGHVIIAGFGLNGRSVARVLKELNLPYVVVDMNPSTVRFERSRGESIVLGDCSRPALLHHVQAKDARALVVVISDPSMTRRSVQVARQLNPALHIIVRTHYVSEVNELRKLGANEIIPEEFETSVEIFARVLQRFLIPRNEILDIIERIRSDHYEVLRRDETSAKKIEIPIDLLGDVQTGTCKVRANSPVIGRSLKELHFRATTGASVIAVRRQGELQANPHAEFVLREGDVMVLVGSGAELDKAVRTVDPPSDESVSIFSSSA
jgi:CPA2 family monovalent cation:H+ antiporter-2